MKLTPPSSVQIHHPDPHKKKKWSKQTKPNQKHKTKNLAEVQKLGIREVYKTSGVIQQQQQQQQGTNTPKTN